VRRTLHRRAGLALRGEAEVARQDPPAPPEGDEPGPLSLGGAEGVDVEAPPSLGGGPCRERATGRGGPLATRSVCSVRPGSGKRL
jgi:hypothetical protein